MKKQWDYFEYRIAEHYLSAMVNCDLSGMDGTECEQYNAFDRQARETAIAGGFTVGHWSPVDDSGDDFGPCDISGHFAMRCTVRLMVYRESAAA